MENARYVDATLDLFRRMRQRSPFVGVALQAYLYRTERDLESLLPLGAALRLVKGAYLEPADVAYPRKRTSTKTTIGWPVAFWRALAAGRAPAYCDARCGAHRAVDGVHRRGEHSAVGLRIRDALRDPAAAAATARRGGPAVRVLISYGEYWFPWYMRRLAERPANVWFVVKQALFGGGMGMRVRCRLTALTSSDPKIARSRDESRTCACSSTTTTGRATACSMRSAALTPDQFTRDMGSSFRSVRDTLAHFYSAEWAWCSRWNGQSPTAHVPPESFPDVATLRAMDRARIRRSRSARSHGRQGSRSRGRIYTMFNGDARASVFWQMVQHVVNHASYHRGQVTTMLRQLGATPPQSMDLITFYRTRGSECGLTRG